MFVRAAGKSRRKRNWNMPPYCWQRPSRHGQFMGSKSRRGSWLLPSAPASGCTSSLSFSRTLPSFPVTGSPRGYSQNHLEKRKDPGRGPSGERPKMKSIQGLHETPAAQSCSPRTSTKPIPSSPRRLSDHTMRISHPAKRMLTDTFFFFLIFYLFIWQVDL